MIISLNWSRCCSKDFVYTSDEPTGRLALVFELMDLNLYEHIKGVYNFPKFLGRK